MSLLDFLSVKNDVNESYFDAWNYNSMQFTASVAISKEGYTFCYDGQIHRGPTCRMPRVMTDCIYGMGIIRGTTILAHYAYRDGGPWLKWPVTVPRITLLTRRKIQRELDRRLIELLEGMDG